LIWNSSFHFADALQQFLLGEIEARAVRMFIGAVDLHTQRRRLALRALLVRHMLRQEERSRTSQVERNRAGRWLSSPLVAHLEGK
jgi:hypothetical protein